MTMPTPPLWFFRDLKLHERLSDDLLARLREEGRVERWGHLGEIFYDAHALDVRVVLKGGLMLEESSRHVPVLLERGDAFGVLASDGEHEQRATLRAHDDTTLVSLSRARFDEWVAPALGNKSIKMRHLRKQRRIEHSVPLAHLLYMSPQRRLATALLMLAEHEQHVGKDAVLIRTPRKMRAMAKLVGLDRARFAEALTYLRLRGLIKPERAQIELPNVEALRAFCQ